MFHINYLPFSRVKTQLCEKNQLASILIYSIYSERSERVEKICYQSFTLKSIFTPCKRVKAPLYGPNQLSQILMCSTCLERPG